MKPPKPPTPGNIAPIDWPNLTDEALEELRRLVEAERERRWFAQQPRSPVDELYDSGRVPHPAHAEAFDTYHCLSHGMRRISRGELRQEERDETVVYVCTRCGQVADPTPPFYPRQQRLGGPSHITKGSCQRAWRGGQRVLGSPVLRACRRHPGFRCGCHPSLLRRARRMGGGRGCVGSSDGSCAISCWQRGHTRFCRRSQLRNSWSQRRQGMGPAYGLCLGGCDGDLLGGLSDPWQSSVMLRRG